MSRPRFSVAALLAVCLLALGAPVAAAAPSPLADCAAHHGSLTHHYGVRELHRALSAITPSFAEYTSCYSAIQNALEVELGGTNLSNLKGAGGSGGGGSGSTLLIVIVAVVLLGGGGAAGWAYLRNRPGTD